MRVCMWVKEKLMREGAKVKEIERNEKEIEGEGDRELV